ncbi:MAG: DUF1653 domain-containing protein, partial [Lachnospiraceae bacterium]|nr:DUF1653 domain-containing protein [Lachnospiraceae bacterium]
NTNSMPSDEYMMGQQNLAIEYRREMVGKTYRHFKGTLYLVENIAVHSETGELRVIYHNIYDDLLVWDRALDMFLSPVDKEKYPDCTQELRFEQVKQDYLYT